MSSETQVVMPMAPHGSPVPSKGSHRSMADEMSMSSNSAISTNQYPFHRSEKSLDDLTVSSYESSESSMSLFMEQIVDMKLDEMSISTKSCSSMQMVSSIASPVSLKSGRKNLLPPSNRPRTNTNESSITGYLTTDSKSSAGGEETNTWSQAAPNLETAVLDRGHDALENEAIGWSYSVDEDDLNPTENNALKSATATAAKLPTAYVLVSGEVATFGHANGNPTSFPRDRSISPMASVRSSNAPPAKAPFHQEHLDKQSHPQNELTRTAVPEEIRMRNDTISHRIHNGSFASSPPRFSPSENDRIYISFTQIQEDDVLCGREERGSPHKGNANYRTIVASKRSSYQALASCERQKKTNMSTHIIDVMVKGRFLVKQGTERYYLLTKDEARKKVSQSLREK